MKLQFLKFISRGVFFHRFAAIFLLLPIGLTAQSSGANTSKSKPDPAQAARELAAYNAGMASAKAQAKNNNVAGAQNAIEAINKSVRNSAGWHITNAQRLMQVAEQMARDGKTAPIPGLSNAALAQLDLADKATTNVRTRSAAKTLAGYIQERYLANSTAAIASYQAAAQLSPGTANRAKEAATRLQRVEENLQLKRSSGRS